MNMAKMLKRRTYTMLMREKHMTQMLDALVYLKRMRVVHRDIKPQNLMVHFSKGLKIVDFGLARVHVEGRANTLPVCTLWYRPVDLCMGRTHYGFDVDVWSAGCVLFECFAGKVAFRSEWDWEQIINVCRLLGTPSASALDDLPFSVPELPKFRSTIEAAYTGRFLSLLQGMLHLDFKRRYTIETAASEYRLLRGQTCS